ncbi:MAG: SPOR domain-containing protein [Lacibacter sp.]|jgi:hypothetical protein
MKRISIIVFFLAIVLASNAQMIRDSIQPNVTLQKDARIDLLLKKKAEINKKATLAKKPTKGYRIQVLNTTDRAQVLSAKSKLLTLYPDQKVYLMYQAPYFKLRFGNFIEKQEAVEYRKQLSILFPSGTFIIPSEIEVKPEPEEEEENKDLPKKN